MKTRRKRSIWLRACNSLCVLTLIASVLYLLLAGFQPLALAALICASAGVATPAVASGGRIAEVITGILEAILDGLSAIVDAIASLFSF